MLNTQLLQLFAQKAAGAPLTFAAELAPVGPRELVTTTWLFAFAWLTTVVLVIRAAAVGHISQLGQSRATLLFLALALSGAFLLLALFSARRAMEQWIGFGFLAIPLFWSTFRPPDRQWLRIAGGLLLAAHLVWTGYRQSLNLELVAYPANVMAEAAAFLEAESEIGDLVFHTRWDNFGPLFARNRANRYLGGMDPIFQFAHDAGAFWEFFYLSIDATREATCNAYPCQDGVISDTHTVLTEHFGARWVLVEPRRNPRFALYLLNDDRYRLALETMHEAVFEVLNANDVAPGMNTP